MWQTFAEWEKTICLQNQIANTAGFTLSIRNFESDQHAKYNATQCQVKKKPNKTKQGFKFPVQFHSWLHSKQHDLSSCSGNKAAAVGITQDYSRRKLLLTKTVPLLWRKRKP